MTFVARVGNDMFGAQAIEGFTRDGINIAHVIRDAQAPSGVALIFVADDGENSIAVASGANARLSPADVEAARQAVTSAAALVCQLETPLETVTAAAGIASDAGVPVILDPAPAQPLGEDLLRQVSVLTPNETEAELLTGIKVADDDGASKAAHALLAQGVQTVLITLGPRGTFVASEQVNELVPSIKVDPVDSTAAGDVFNGALAVALAEGTPLLASVRFANAAAALSVTRLGAQPSAPCRADIEACLDRQR